jgi:hypothetical protein
LGGDAYAYSALEKGVAGKRTHVHVLLGWPRGGISRTNWIAFHKKVERLWRHGKVHLERYDPRRGAAQYLVKDSAQFPDQGEFIGDPKKVRQRKKKRTRKERDDGR